MVRKFKKTTKKEDDEEDSDSDDVERDDDQDDNNGEDDACNVNFMLNQAFEKPWRKEKIFIFTRLYTLKGLKQIQPKKNSTI